MKRKMTLFALAGSSEGLGASGLVYRVDAWARPTKKPSPASSEASAAAPKPQPVSHRNSRLVRRQKFPRFGGECIALLLGG
jgi:hypothetical protein